MERQEQKKYSHKDGNKNSNGSRRSKVDRAAITLPSVTEEDLQSLKTNNVVNRRHEEGIKPTQEMSC